MLKSILPRALLSWRLWRALNHPPAEHPLFWRTLHDRAPETTADRRGLFDRLVVFYLLFVVIMVFVIGAINLSVNTPLLTLLVVLLALPIFAPFLAVLRSTLFSGLIYGLQWADEISQSLSQERQNHTYELLSLLPSGVLAPSWAICMGCLYRNRRFQHMLEQRGAMMRIIAGTGGMFVLVMATNAGDWLRWAILLAGILVTLHLDLVHSLVLSALIGMLIPHYTHSRVDVRLWTIGGFLFLQIAAYTLALLVALVIAPHVMSRLALPFWLLDTCQIMIGITSLHLARECLITALWRWLLTIDNATDLDSTFRFAA